MSRTSAALQQHWQAEDLSGSVNSMYRRLYIDLFKYSLARSYSDRRWLSMLVFGLGFAGRTHPSVLDMTGHEVHWHFFPLPKRGLVALIEVDASPWEALIDLCGLLGAEANWLPRCLLSEPPHQLTTRQHDMSLLENHQLLEKTYSKVFFSKKKNNYWVSIF